jgi:hypothetical protein
LSYATWSLADQYNTSLTVIGNDGFRLTAGAPPFAFDGVLLILDQHYCDVATDEDVFRDLSAFDTVSPSNVQFNDAVTRASVHGSFGLAGIERRTPNCASPDYGNSVTTFPSITVDVNLNWLALAPGNNAVTQVSTFNVVDAYGHTLANSITQNGQVDASVTGTVTSEDPSLTWGGLNTPLLSFIVRQATLNVQMNQCCG